MSRQQIPVLFGLLSFAFVAVGCSTQGAFIEEDAAAELQASVATAEELEAALGSPSVTIPRSDGTIMWVYEGVYTVAGPTSWIPYVNLVAGMNNQKCTRLTVLVDREDGTLSDWQYVTAKDIDYWANTDDKCHSQQE